MAVISSIMAYHNHCTFQIEVHCYIGVVFITITLFSKVSPPLFYWTIYFLLGRIVWDFFKFILRRTDDFLITTALRGIRRENSKS